MMNTKTRICHSRRKDVCIHEMATVMHEKPPSTTKVPMARRSWTNQVALMKGTMRRVSTQKALKILK
jgi:hypothetical protein